MQTSLMYDTSKRRIWATHGSICGFETEDGKIDVNDLAFGRHRILNTSLRIPEVRGDYLRYNLIYLLEQKDAWLSIQEIWDELGIHDERRRARILRYLMKSLEENYLEEHGGKYRLNPAYGHSWQRLKHMVRMIGKQLFEENSLRNPLLIKKGEKDEWLTTHDLCFLNGFAQ